MDEGVKVPSATAVVLVGPTTPVTVAPPRFDVDGHGVPAEDVSVGLVPFRKRFRNRCSSGERVLDTLAMTEVFDMDAKGVETGITVLLGAKPGISKG